MILDTQYGFQSNRSTNHALTDVITNSFENINKNLYTGLIFLDLTKAFDTVNHEILLVKLDHYGIRGQANDLLRAFLNRKQFVSINNHESPLLPLYILFNRSDGRVTTQMAEWYGASVS